MKKKLMATLLALALVLSLVPTVFAADNSGGDTPAATCATCGCTLATCSECKAATEDARAAAVCNCKAGEEGTGHSCGTSCKFQKCTEEGCTENGKYVDKTSHTTHTYTCVNATAEGVCKAETHNAGCIEKCDKQANCAATGAHKKGCAKGDKIKYFTEAVTFELTCDCGENHDGNGNHVAAEDPVVPASNVACARKVTVKAVVSYSVLPAGDEVTEAEKTAALKTATDTKKTELEAKTKVSESEILYAAKERARQIISQAEERARRLYQVANEYADDALTRTEEAVQAALSEVKESRARFRAISAARLQEQRDKLDRKPQSEDEEK